MPWTITFTQDTERPGVGTATAVFTDPENGVIVTSHSGRIDDSDSATYEEFLNSALAMYEKRVVISSDTAALINKLTVILNEKVGAK